VSDAGLSIDRFTRSRKNSFTSVRLDRLAEYRDDAQWVRSALASDAARFVPLWRGRNLLSRQAGEQLAIYLEPGQIEIPEGVHSPTLLGSDGKRFFFAISLDDRQKAQALACHPDSDFVDLRQASMDMDAKHAGVLAYAKALLYWQYRNAFCGVCGSANEVRSTGHRLACTKPDCGRESFPRIDPAIIVLVTQGDACLLGRNASWPPKRFSALAGFVEPGESLEDAVVREVLEESRVRLRQVTYVSSQPWPFPASAMCGFYAEAESRDCAASDEMEELRWVTPESLRDAITSGAIRLPPPVSIAYRLIDDWYERHGGGDLESLVRASGSWLVRK
jgi:NAD+ diphosphatase